MHRYTSTHTYILIHTGIHVHTNTHRVMRILCICLFLLYSVSAKISLAKMGGWFHLFLSYTPIMTLFHSGFLVINWSLKVNITATCSVAQVTRKDNFFMTPRPSILHLSPQRTQISKSKNWLHLKSEVKLEQKLKTHLI
jgi:hypothetical protein